MTDPTDISAKKNPMLRAHYITYSRFDVGSAAPSILIQVYCQAFSIVLTCYAVDDLLALTTEVSVSRRVGHLRYCVVSERVRLVRAAEFVGKSI